LQENNRDSSAGLIPQHFALFSSRTVARIATSSLERGQID